MKLLLPVAVYAGVAASQIQIPLITDAAFKAWMPPAGALSDREFQHRCGTVMAPPNGGLASREPKPKASVERRQVVAREPEPEFVPLRNGGSRKRWNAFEGHEA
ncbi:hypothetical protein HIM_07788 [Hirsutella minnesotensis 3608]|uniref:Uncharacterized protein n=1 Tax=Hirsutella minnesotensis 3608 TaxID=1043627 RepID=A0A0F8A426_9HYPO|nr:hypothetical protein HIM_07788 [Hirsutella minnesotensis 3608]